MAHEMINGTFRQTNLPNESDEYLSKREELRLAEIELMRQRERVQSFAVDSHKAPRSRTTHSRRVRRNSTPATRRSEPSD